MGGALNTDLNREHSYTSSALLLKHEYTSDDVERFLAVGPASEKGTQSTKKWDEQPTSLSQQGLDPYTEDRCVSRVGAIRQKSGRSWRREKGLKPSRDTNEDANRSGEGAGESVLCT